MFSLGMVLLEVLTCKKVCFFIYIYIYVDNYNVLCLHTWTYMASANILLLQVGTDGFAKRTPIALFVLDMETIMTEIPVAAPYILVKLMKLCLAQEVWWKIHRLVDVLLIYTLNDYGGGPQPRERPNAIEARKWLKDLLEALPKDGEQLPSLPEVVRWPVHFSYNLRKTTFWGFCWLTSKLWHTHKAQWDFEEKDDSLTSSSSTSPTSRTKPISREDVPPPTAKQNGHSVNRVKQKESQRQCVKSSPLINVSLFPDAYSFAL